MLIVQLLVLFIAYNLLIDFLKGFMELIFLILLLLYFVLRLQLIVNQ